MKRLRLVCPWDRKSFVARGSGKPQKFCREECRRDFHAAQRAYSQQRLDSGAITIEDLKAALLARHHVRKGV